ncbi:MAG: M17 family peptidase N-terminal domain-containing protein, partial [Anaerolineaceae bacterium]
MTDSNLYPITRLTVHLQEKTGWKGALILSICYAPEKPAPGLPGKEAGDITLTGETTGLVSLGTEDKISAEVLRRVGGAIARWAAKNELTSLALDLSDFSSSKVNKPCVALTEGLALGSYRFDHYKSERQDVPVTDVALLLDKVTPAETSAVEQTQTICAAVNMSREWAHEPANVINPITLAERAKQVSKKYGLKCTVLDDKDLTRMGAGGIINVGMGSKTPARMIILEYAGNGDSDAKPVVLVGKALTFDSGGYSLKDRNNIVSMKYDKCGGV